MGRLQGSEWLILDPAPAGDEVFLGPFEQGFGLPSAHGRKAISKVLNVLPLGEIDQEPIDGNVRARKDWRAPKEGRVGVVNPGSFRLFNVLVSLRTPVPSVGFGHPNPNGC